MNPFDPAAMSAMWGAGAQSFLDSQKRLFEAVMKATPGAPAAMADTAGLTAAQEALSRALADAEAIAATISAGLRAGPWADPVALRMVERIFDPRGWVREADTPDGLAAAFGLPSGFEAKLAALGSAWTSSRRLKLERDALILNAWRLAAGRFAESLAARAAAGETSDDPTALMGLWVGIADEALRETQRTDVFLANQRASIAAEADVRLAQGGLGAAFAEACGLPTRRELDDVHRAMTEMRREIRALEQRCATSPASQVPAKKRSPKRRRAEERPEAASRSTHERSASFETSASRAPQDEEVGVAPKRRRPRAVPSPTSRKKSPGKARP